MFVMFEAQKDTEPSHSLHCYAVVGLESRYPGIPKSRDPGLFSDPEIPGLRLYQSRDFGID